MLLDIAIGAVKITLLSDTQRIFHFPNFSAGLAKRGMQSYPGGICKTLETSLVIRLMRSYCGMQLLL